MKYIYIYIYQPDNITAHQQLGTKLHQESHDNVCAKADAEYPTTKLNAGNTQTKCEGGVDRVVPAPDVVDTKKG